MKTIKSTKARPLEMLGYLTLIWILPVKRETTMIAVQNAVIATDMRTRPQKKAKVKPVLGGSFDKIGLPDMALITFLIK
jgi:hypothetical protein